MHPLLSDPWVAARIDAKLSRYRGLPEADLHFMREELAERLLTDEAGLVLLRRARPRHVDQSGEAVIGPLEESEPSEGKRRKGVGA